MEQVYRSERLKPGDVLMVARDMKAKRGKKFVWRFFLVVSDVGWRYTVNGYVVGNEKLKDEEIKLYFNTKNTIHLLDQAEWPDGVHAYRMSMILRGLIDGVADL